MVTNSKTTGAVKAAVRIAPVLNSRRPKDEDPPHPTTRQRHPHPPSDGPVKRRRHPSPGQRIGVEDGGGDDQAMSYCRFAWGGSDVYVFMSREGIECCGCRLSKGHFVVEDQEDMISHLAEHRRQGHFVPFHAIEELWHEIPGATEPKDRETLGLTVANLQWEKMAIEHELEKKTKELESMKAQEPPR